MLMEYIKSSKSLPEMMPKYRATKEIALKHLMAVHLEERVMTDLFTLPEGCIGTVEDFLARYPDYQSRESFLCFDDRLSGSGTL